MDNNFYSSTLLFSPVKASDQVITSTIDSGEEDIYLTLVEVYKFCLLA